MNTLRTVSDCIALATDLKKEWFSKEPTWCPWFRGQTDATWTLSPKLYRGNDPKRGIRILEDELRQEFVVRAPGLAEIGPLGSWEWYFMMQHHGAPTRLLDWTEGALIALYFAVRDNNEDRDAAMWILDPWWLNKLIVGQREVIPPGAEIGLSSEDAKRYKRWLPARYSTAKLPSKPVAVYPTHSARRISTQRSCFTIHGSDKEALGILAIQADSRIIKVIIPKAAISTIKTQLSVTGIDEVTIYPDLDGLGRYLNDVLQTEKRDV